MDPDASEAREEPPASQPVPLPLHWEVHGGEGRPILLLHGFGTNGYTWTRWVTELAKSYRVFVVEMKGFGNSPKPRDGQYRPQDQALLLHRLILQWDLRDFILVGHSLGGVVALLTALRLCDEDPSRLRKLVLIAAPVMPQPVSPFIRLAGRSRVGPALLRLLPPRLLIRTALEWAYFDPSLVTDAQVEAYAEPLRSRDGRYALSLSARQIIPEDLQEFSRHLRKLTVPALLLWGEEDPIVPLPAARRAEAVLPNATLEVLPECGHMPQEERPRESLDLVLGFLEENS